MTTLKFSELLDDHFYMAIFRGGDYYIFCSLGNNYSVPCMSGGGYVNDHGCMNINENSAIIGYRKADFIEIERFIKVMYEMGIYKKPTINNIYSIF